jgi:hypothetical protein
MVPGQARMSINTDLLGQLARVVAWLGTGWLLAGLLISTGYHLSLYIFDGEFRVGEQRLLDIFISILRFVVYLLFWPVVFVFDRTALTRIKMLLLYASPAERERNPDLQEFVQERRYRRWITSRYLEQQELERRRAVELATGDERRRRTLELHDGNPELDRYWLLTGVGSNPAGVSELVRLYPEYYIAEEIAAKAQVEIGLRKLQECPRCSARVPVREVRAPKLSFLRVLEPEGSELVAEGWALCGDYSIEFAECPDCGATIPAAAGDVTEFGRAPDVVRVVRLGLNYHWDLP